MPALLAVTALAGTAVAPADAKPIGPCDGPCPPALVAPSKSAPPAKSKLVKVYRSTYAYSTPYLNARRRYPLRATSYIATCEAYTTSAGRYGNRWWTRLRSGTWVNNGDLSGGVKMGIGDCRAPRNDAVTKPAPLPRCVPSAYQKKYLSYIRGFKRIPPQTSHSVMRLTWQPDLCKDGLGRYGARWHPTLESIGVGRLGLGLHLRAPERTARGITYRGDILACASGSHKGISFGGPGCMTVGRAQITATATSSGVRVAYHAKTLAASKLGSGKWAWTNKPVGLF